jgi:hypothetical protein
MATTNKSEKIIIGIDDKVIELTGVEKDAFIAQQKLDIEIANQIKAEAQARAAQKAALLERLGITTEEAQLLLS